MGSQQRQHLSFQGAAESSDISKCSLLHTGVAIRQAWHDFTLLSTSLSMCGNQIFSRNNALVFTNPWRPSCVRLTKWSSRLFGTTMRVPCKIRLPELLTVRSSFTLSRRQKSMALTLGRPISWSQLPFITAPATACKVASSRVAVSISCVLKALGVEEVARYLTYSSATFCCRIVSAACFGGEAIGSRQY